METKQQETRQDDHDRLQLEELTDLAPNLEQTEELKGGISCQNNLKQIGIALHN